MFTNKKDIENIANDIVERLKQSFRNKDMVVTGKTMNSIRYELDYANGVLLIKGSSTIQFNEYGRAPLSSTQSDGSFLKNLENWVRIRGINIPAKTLKYFINKRGTRLWQGRDVRFNGRESNVISDVINANLAKELTMQLSGLALKNITKQIRDSTVDITKI